MFHLAAEPGVRASWRTRFDRYVHNNVTATQHLLEATSADPSRRVVYALCAIAGRPLDVRRRPREDGDVLHTGADISRARERLGYEPSTSLEDGLAELEWALRARAPARPRAASRA